MSFDKYLSTIFNSEKTIRIFSYFLTFFCITIGFLFWEVALHGFFISHQKRIIALVLMTLWSFIFFFIFFYLKKIKVRFYVCLLLLTYSLFYSLWASSWGMIPSTITYFFPELTVTIIIVIIFIYLGILKLHRSEIDENLSLLFSRHYIREIFILLLFLSSIFLFVKGKYDNTDGIIEKHLIYFSDRNYFPMDYRLLPPYLVETTAHLFEDSGVDYLSYRPRLYKIYILGALTLAFYLYYIFLTRFFRREVALFISFLLFALFHISFYVGGLFEDPFNILFFVLGIIFLYSQKEILFFFIVFLSSFNRETTWFLIFFYVCHHIQFINKKNFWKLFLKMVFLAAIFIGVIVYKFSIKPINEMTFHNEIQSNYLWYNFSCEHCNLHLFLFLSSFWILAFFFMEFPKELQFFKRLNFVTPFFVAWHYLGLIREVRYFIIIALIIVPLGMSLLFPDAILQKAQKELH